MKDGSFVQEVTIKADSKGAVAKGAWHYEPESGYITFDGTFMLVLDGFRHFDPNYAVPKTGSITTEVGTTFGRITIGVDESGRVYQKQ